MASAYIHDSLTSLLSSSASIAALPFRRTHVLSHAALAPEEWFEAHLIRDAEPHERALFRADIDSATGTGAGAGAGTGGEGRGMDGY